MLRKKTTHFLIIKDEEWDDLKCEWWNVKSLLAQHDALSAEENMKLDSSCNYAFLQSNACICKHA